MKKSAAAYVLWLFLVVCLYFFENDTGTRTVLICSLLVPLLPPLREVFFPKHTPGQSEKAQIRTDTVPSPDEEPGDIRPYRAGDPVRLIHWKLSARTGKLLVRETEVLPGDILRERKNALPVKDAGEGKGKKLLLLILALMLICILTVTLLPEVRRSAQALCNRIFAASEKNNAYAYTYFPVGEDQSILPAVLAGIVFLALYAAGALLLHSRIPFLMLAAACALTQVYFGLALPVPVTVTVYSLAAAGTAARPLRPRAPAILLSAVLCVYVFTAVLIPGRDGRTEAASEKARDLAARFEMQITGLRPETKEEDTTARHLHHRSLSEGMGKAAAGREFRQVTLEEEEISMPSWTDSLRVLLLSLSALALLILPFVPFYLWDRRKKAVLEKKRPFASENVNEAVCAIFGSVIQWLEASGHGAGNLLYRDWVSRLPDLFGEGYRKRFLECAMDFEEAAYFSLPLSEDKRQRAMALLSETENVLWKAAGMKRRLIIKYRKCLC